jgi:hypothetical protein
MKFYKLEIWECTYLKRFKIKKKLSFKNLKILIENRENLRKIKSEENQKKTKKPRENDKNQRKPALPH